MNPPRENQKILRIIAQIPLAWCKAWFPEERIFSGNHLGIEP